MKWRVALALLVVTAIAPRVARAQAALINGLGGPAGFGSGVLLPNDDASSGAISLSAYDLGGLCFFGRTHTTLYVNNNGHVSFGAPVAAFTPAAFPVTAAPMIAPWWADVDTRGTAVGTPPENRVYWSVATGRLVVTWFRVGYYAAHVDRRNSFQLVITRVTGSSDYDVEFRYNELAWTTGDASGGMGGVGGTPAQAGFDAGDGLNFSVLPGSRSAAVLALASGSNITPPLPGLWRFRFRSCRLVCVSNADCGGATPICDGTTRQCRACRADSDCSAPTPACATDGAGAGRCVQCTMPAHCPARFTCDAPRRLCVGCLTNADCGGTTPVCELSTHVCRPCDPANATDCVGDTPVCGPQGSCVECAPGLMARCVAPTPHCSARTFRCVACATNADCESTEPVCGPGGNCVLCTPAMPMACATNPDGRACLPGTATDVRCGCAGDPDCSADRTCEVPAGRCVLRPIATDAGTDGGTPDAQDEPEGPLLRVRGGSCRCRVAAVGRSADHGVLRLAALAFAMMGCRGRTRRRRCAATSGPANELAG